MTIVNPALTQFNTGEVTPFLLGRTDFKKYQSSAQYMENCIPLVYGPFLKRSGTRFVNGIKAFSIASISSNNAGLTFTTGTVPSWASVGQTAKFTYDGNAWKTVTGATATLSDYGIASVTGTPVVNDTITCVYGDSTTLKVILKPFTFSKDQAYTLEIGATTIASESYIRFYTKNGILVDSNNAIVQLNNLGYLASDLENLRFAQSNDFLYIASGRLPVKILKRTSHTSWTIENMVFSDGPYQDENTDDSITISASARTGASVDLTANKAVFYSHMINMPIRLRKVAVGESEEDAIGWGYITAITDTKHAKCVVKSKFFDTEATYAWRIGEFSDPTISSESSIEAAKGRGYPKHVTLFKGRLAFASTKTKPNSVWLSMADSYHDFAPTALLNNEVEDDKAIYLTLATSETNQIQWMTALRQLFIGTLGAEFKIGASDNVPTPSNCNSEEVSQYGSTTIVPVKAANELIYVQQAERKLRTMYYTYSSDSYDSTDLSLFGEHLTYSGIAGLVQQVEPYSTLWVWLNNGDLRSISYQKDQEVVAWARQVLGGNRVKVLSACSIPFIEENRDCVYLLVERWINGKFVRYIETIDRVFDDQVTQEMGYFVDCGGTYNSPLNITNIYSDTTSAVTYTIITCPNHGLATGTTRKIRFDDIADSSNTTDDDTKGYELLNKKSYLAEAVNATTLRIELDSSDYITYNQTWQGGVIRFYIDKITSGIDHLEGEDVWVVIDGAVTSKTKVVNGTVELDSPGTVVHIGLPYTCKYKSVRLDTALGTNNALASKQRIHSLYLKVLRTSYFRYGAEDADEVKPARKYTIDKLDFPPELKTELIEIPFEAEWTREPVLTIESDLPVPLCILGITTQMSLNLS